MLLLKERKLLVEYGKKLVTTNLTSGTGGNLSIYNRDENLVAVTPSGVDYMKTTVEDIVITDIDGNVVEGDNRPTSELSFHLSLYKDRADVCAVVHTHSVYATTVACLGMELPAVHYMVGYSGSKVPLAPYCTFGSPELAESIIEHIGGYNAVLLANHGLVTVSGNMPTAFAAAEEIEFVARIFCQAKSIGSPIILDDVEMETVVEKFKWYGKKK
ncbi:class II aldolase/adducin family protein [Denitrovibrio acetiphilus DSM 12809]|uniref:Class II aldolase/adducin family protein n=1 Tax=Denitrovibrio acetiphilus (strain DSM 12809 / NBRC 114555 / N2460) TaxID=522772 RepID=D4H284_DENA2|nr:L-fuculose-phosphate aldolase [Denitrovibrio acetiphilus]ADD68875.1 class II aldolase/adducin family protein [Denitrovibrio acetiphilus DSM 12809]